MRPRLATGGLAAAAALVLSATASAADHPVAVQDFQFAPASVTVAVGDSVTWNYATGISKHNVDFTDGAAFKQPAEAQAPGWTATRTFDTAGTFHYVCDLHSFMTGTVVVTGDGAPAHAADTTAPAATHVKVVKGRLRFALSEDAALRGHLVRAGKPVRQVGVALKAGSVSYRLPRHLKRGRYTIRFSLVDAAGNRSQTYSASFKVT